MATVIVCCLSSSLCQTIRIGLKTCIPFNAFHCCYMCCCMCLKMAVFQCEHIQMALCSLSFRNCTENYVCYQYVKCNSPLLRMSEIILNGFKSQNRTERKHFLSAKGDLPRNIVVHPVYLPLPFQHLPKQKYL